MKYKAVIFDLDGTLLDTINDISDSVNETLKKYNYRVFSIEDYKYFAGRGIDELIYSVLEKAEINPNEFDKIKLGYVQEYATRHNAKTKLFDGILNLLIELKKLGVSVNVLSNKPHFQTVEVIDYYFKDFKFDQVVGKKPEFRIKPYPESALDLIKQLNLSPKDVLYIGDTNTDIETAINAKFDSVGVLWGFRKKIELMEAGADYIVSEPNDILRIVLGDNNDFKQK